MSAAMDELARRLGALKQAALDVSMHVNALDGKYDQRENEIKALEIRIERLKEEAFKIQEQSNKIIQDASEQGSLERKEAAQLLTDAKIAKAQAKMDQDRATQMTNEAQAQMKAAIERQKEADVQYRILEEKKKRILEATR